MSKTYKMSDPVDETLIPHRSEVHCERFSSCFVGPTMRMECPRSLDVLMPPRGVRPSEQLNANRCSDQHIVLL